MISDHIRALILLHLHPIYHSLSRSLSKVSTLLWPCRHRQTHDKSSSSFFLPPVSLSNSHSLYLASRLPLFWIGNRNRREDFFFFFFLSLFAFPSLCFFVLGFGALGPSARLMFVVDLWLRDQRMFFFFFENGYVCFVVVWPIVLALMGLWLKSIYIILFLFFCW